MDYMINQLIVVLYVDRLPVKTLFRSLWFVCEAESERQVRGMETPRCASIHQLAVWEIQQWTTSRAPKMKV